MRGSWRGWLLLAITTVGCAGGPPLDELPLRDALRAEPDVVAALPDDARARLAARFQAEGAGDTASDPVEAGALAASPLVAQADVARQHRSADALVIGLVGGGAAQALPAGSQAAVTAALPPLEGPVATSTADLESRALAGVAGASLRELLAASRATRLERVVGWPVAAVAIGDTIYVNAAWLAAVAPGNADGGACDSGACDGGRAGAGWPDGGALGGSMSSGSGTGAGGAAGWAGSEMAGSLGGRGGAGGHGGRGGAGGGTGGWYVPIDTTPPAWQPPSTPTSSTDPGTSAAGAAAAADGCASLADSCDSSDDGYGSSDDSCGSQGDGSGGDSCSGSSDYGGGDGTCQTAPGRGHTRPATIAWLFAPLLYLWGRKR
jgi:hypothetical protein